MPADRGPRRKKVAAHAQGRGGIRNAVLGGSDTRLLVMHRSADAAGMIAPTLPR
ncbi:hypothetical protein [Streptodolium elevatio]